jgi:hypothetical protein
VSPAGGKLWLWDYRHDGKGKTMAFGKYPDVPLALARERHGAARKVLAAGTDPMAQRKATRTAEQVASENSFASVAEKWLEHWRGGKSLRHVDSTRRRLASNILPSLGSLQVADLLDRRHNLAAKG